MLSFEKELAAGFWGCISAKFCSGIIVGSAARKRVRDFSQGAIHFHSYDDLLLLSERKDAEALETQARPVEESEKNSAWEILYGS